MITLEDEFMLARLFAPLLSLEPAALSERLDQLEEQEPQVPELVLEIITQSRVTKGMLLEKIPRKKRTDELRLKLLHTGLFNVLRHTVSKVLKDISRSSSVLTVYSRDGKTPLASAKGE